jgi:hypothetical protein
LDYQYLKGKNSVTADLVAAMEIWQNRTGLDVLEYEKLSLKLIFKGQYTQKLFNIY